MLKTFLILTLIFGIVVGMFFGMAFTANLRGFKKWFWFIVTTLVTGMIIAGAFCLEQYSNEQKWNGGKCDICGTDWTFSNADHQKNSGTIYFWHCNKCNKVIELNSQF